MIAADTGVVVAAFATWHESHDAAVAALDRHVRSIGHVLVETYSVLTRLPPPHRVAFEHAAEYLRRTFTGRPLVLSGAGYRRLVAIAGSVGITDGAIYDALVATTASEADALLLTLDRRAVPTYEAVGARYELIA